MSDSSGPHVLFCAFAEVPGTSAEGTRTAQWLSVFGSRDVDALSLKGSSVAHIQRLAGARMMRVPNTLGKPFLQRISTYQRALQRQLAGDAYDLIWCADLFSAAIVAPEVKDGPPMIVEISQVPSQRTRALLGEDNPDLQKKWREQERLAIRAAHRVILPSRSAARLLSERIDPRYLVVAPRAVDRSVFTPPTVEISLDDKLVLIFGGREGGALTRAVLGIAQSLAASLPPMVRIGILGMPGPVDADLKASLARRDLLDRVELVDADSSFAVVAALSQADVVVVPSSAEDELEPFALPHRALEAMACGRAVVVTGSEASFKDTATPGEHFVIAPARDPNRVADAVAGLLADTGWRDSVRRAAARHIERTADLEARSIDVHQALVEATGVQLRLHPPRDADEQTSSQLLPEAPLQKAKPKPKMEPAVELAVDSGPAPRAQRPTASPPPAASQPAPPPAMASDPGALPPMQTIRMEMPQLGSLEAPHGMWEGDTFLDGALAPNIETNPDADRVKAAMLLSSDARSRSERSAPPAAALGDAADTLRASSDDEPVEVSDEDLESVDDVIPVGGSVSSFLNGAVVADGPGDLGGLDDVADDDPSVKMPASPRTRSLPTEPPVNSHTSNPPSVPTSLLVQAALLDSKAPSSDPWAPDTIADGMPVELARPEPSASPRVPTKKSFLVDEQARQTLIPGETGVRKRPGGDMTTEDAALSSLSSDEG